MPVTTRKSGADLVGERISLLNLNLPRVKPRFAMPRCGRFYLGAESFTASLAAAHARIEQ